MVAYKIILYNLKTSFSFQRDNLYQYTYISGLPRLILRKTALRWPCPHMISIRLLIPIVCKLVADNKIMQYVMRSITLVLKITSYRDLWNEFRHHENKTNRIVNCLNDTMWRNKHIYTEIKSRLPTRPILTNSAQNSTSDVSNWNHWNENPV